MVDYFTPTEPNYMMPPPNAEERLSEPIIPTGRLGATVAEQQQGGGTFLHNIQSAVRSGTGSVQLMFNVPHTSAVGGRPKGYGKEVREAMKRVIQDAKVEVTGAEMPTSSMTNMSGYNGQMDEFNDQVLDSHMQEVRDAMSFLADVSGGGGVDVVSMEFPRTIADQRWAKNGETFEGYQNELETGIKKLVDARTGKKKANIPLNYKMSIPEYEEKNGEVIPVFDDNGCPKMRELKIKDFEDQYDDSGRKIKTREELFYDEIGKHQMLDIQGQIQQQEGSVGYSKYLLSDWEQQLKNKALSEEQKENLQTAIEGRRKEIEGAKKQIAVLEQKKGELNEELSNMKSAEIYGVDKTVHSYAELGVHAMHETNARKLDRDLWVGPELGWPTQFGGQPKEWIHIIKDARNKMVNMLTEPEIKDPSGKMIKNNYYRPGMNKEKALEEAKQHIKGVLDTGHLGMWLTHFRRKPGESEQDRVDAFNKWYLKQIDEIIKEEDIVGDIQIVDSQSGAHAHLPPGEGILPLKEAMKKFNKAGFKGGFISEGHGEEQFARGRILTQAWKHFGATPGGIYGPSGTSGGMGPIYGTPWGNIQNAYFGRTYTPFFIVGAYSPSNDWKVWSEVPLE